MRRRRVDRCLLRAEEALSAGFDADAREALEEARHLAPSSTPTLEALRSQVTSREARSTPPRSATGSHRLLSAVALAAVVTTLIFAGFALLSRTDDVGQLPASATNLPAPSQPTTSPAPLAGTPSVVLADATADVVSRSARDVVVPASSSDGSSASDTGPVRAKLKNPPASIGTTGSERPPAVVDSVAAVEVAPPEPSRPAMVVPPAVAVTPLDASAAGRPASGPTVPVVPPAAPSPEPAEPGIRAVLSSYESAFGSLDAAAVHRVWPAVDEQALARAFAGLASQSISLGRCAIAVNGEGATAQCNGSTTWEPKIGGGTRTDARRWEFALQNAGATWQIVRADVR